MIRRARALFGWVSAGAALGLGAVAEAVPAATVPLELTLQTRDDRGHVYCALWASADGFPTERARSVYEARATRIDNRRARMRLRVRPGAYAVACFHDENANQRLDRNFIGIPSEGTGASNDARGFMGPPPFDGARFSVSSTTAMAIQMQYF